MNKVLIKIMQINPIIQINQLSHSREIKHRLFTKIDNKCNSKLVNQCKLNNQSMKNTTFVQNVRDSIKLICYSRIIVVIIIVENVQINIR